MVKYDRSFLRERARREHKKFIKENPKYKKVTFKEYYKLFKDGLVGNKPEVEKSAEKESHSATQHLEQLDDMFVEDLEEEDEVKVASSE
jgi:hypothetical protein